jgi:hypothetical protein
MILKSVAKLTREPKTNGYRTRWLRGAILTRRLRIEGLAQVLRPKGWSLQVAIFPAAPANRMDRE